MINRKVKNNVLSTFTPALCPLQAANLKHGIPGGKPEYLEFSDTPLEVIWSLYTAFK